MRSSAFLSHAAAGVAGAALTLVAAAALGLLAGREATVPSDLNKRLAAREKAQAQQTAVSDKLATADKRLSVLMPGLEEQAKAVAALKSEQAKLAADAKALESRIAAPETGDRLAKLETAVAALAPDKAGSTPAAERLAARLADVERLSGETGE